MRSKEHKDAVYSIRQDKGNTILQKKRTGFQQEALISAANVLMLPLSASAFYLCALGLNFRASRLLTKSLEIGIKRLETETRTHFVLTLTHLVFMHTHLVGGLYALCFDKHATKCISSERIIYCLPLPENYCNNIWWLRQRYTKRPAFFSGKGGAKV